MEKYQEFDPFKFVLDSGQSGMPPPQMGKAGAEARSDIGSR
jgi:hypothetical protein